jgi:hypothetical protein
MTQEAKIPVTASDNTAGPLGSVVQRLMGIASAGDSVNQKLSKAFGADHVARLQTSLGGLQGKLAVLGLGSGATALGGFAAIKSGIDAIVDTAQKADRISDIGKRLRLNPEEFQVFEKLAKESDASLEEVGSSFLKFKINIGKAVSAGGKDLEKLNKDLQAFGLTAQDARDMKPLDLMKTMGLVSSKSDTEADEMLKIEKFRALAGKTGATLIPVFEAIGTKYDITAQKMRDSGLLMTADMAEMGGRAFKAFEKSKGAVDALKLAFGIEMMPVFEQFSNIMESRMKANRTAMMPGVKALANVLSQNLKPFLDDMDTLADKTSGAFKWLAKLAGLVGWDKVVFGGFLLIVSPFVAGAFAVANSLLAITLAAGPWLIVAGALAFVGYSIYQNWDKLSPVFSNLWNSISTGILPVLDSFTPLINIFKSFKSETKSSAKEWGNWASAGELAGNIIIGVLKSLLTPIAAVFDALQILGTLFTGKTIASLDSMSSRLWNPQLATEAKAANYEQDREMSRLSRLMPIQQISYSGGQAEINGKLVIDVNGPGQIRKVESTPNFTIDAHSGLMFAN